MRLALLLSLLLLTTTAFAEYQDPLNPDAPVAATTYKSTFSDYQKFKEVKSNQWKAVNKNASEHGMTMDDMSDMKMDDMQPHDMKNMDMKDMEMPANPHAGHHMQEMDKK